MEYRIKGSHRNLMKLGVMRYSDFRMRLINTCGDFCSDEIILKVSNSEAVAHNGKNSKHGMRADHLLNFSYAPLSSQEPGGATHPGRRGYRSRQTVLTKPQFLQANCQFVVKESTGDAAEYLDHLTDPDKMVDWSSIEQVVRLQHQMQLFFVTVFARIELTSFSLTEVDI